MKDHNINRMYTVYQGLCKNKGYVHEAYMWDGHTRVAVSADATRCRATARATIRKAQAVQFIGTLRTQVQAVNNDTSGNPRVTYTARLHLTDAALCPAPNVRPHTTHTTQQAKADRGYASSEQPVSAASAWVQAVVEEYCNPTVATGQLVFLVDPTRHTPSETDARATPSNPVHGSYVEQAYLVYAVPANTQRALREVHSHLQVLSSTLPRLTEHYYHLYRRAVAYNKAVRALEEQLLVDPVSEHNTSEFIRLRDVYRTSLTINLDKP